MLLNNYSVLNSNIGREIGGGGVCNLFTYYKASTFRNFYTGEGETKKSNLFTGTQPPNSIVLADKGGELSSTTAIDGLGDFNISSLAMGLAAESSLTGSGDVTSANLSLVIQMTCNILASGDISAALVGKLEMASALSGSGNISGALSLIAYVVSELTGSGTTEGTFYGTQSLSSDISSSSTLSPENLAAAVWNTIAASFNIAGSMGAKLNAASAAGDPWGAAIPGSYLATEAGGILSKIQTLVDELHQLEGLKDGAPMVVTPTSRTVGSITLEITGDGENLTQVERV